MASRKQARTKPQRRGRRRSALSSTAETPDSDDTASVTLPRRRTLLGRLFRWLRLLVLGGLGLMLVHLIVFAFVPPVSLLMIERWVTGQPVKRDYVSLDDISPRLIASVIASEDSQFCRHWGVDFTAVWDVLEQAWDAEEAPTRGASTITMQVTKTSISGNSPASLESRSKRRWR